VLALVAPGQGSQKQGMYLPWMENKEFKESISLFSSICGLNLTELGSKADIVELKNTRNAQVLIVSLSLITAKLLNLHKYPNENIIYSGHSVGEVCAYSLSGIFSELDAIKIVNQRGETMSKISLTIPSTGMVAILGGEKEFILQDLKIRNLIAANINSSNQIIAAGESKYLELLIKDPPAGTKTIKLDVAAAFHTEFMKEACALFAEVFKGIELQDPESSLVTNSQGLNVTTAAQALQELINQLSSPVRWDLCQKTFQDLGVTGILELAPSGTLVGIAKKELPNVELFAIKSPSDLDLATSFIEKHSGK